MGGPVGLDGNDCPSTCPVMCGVDTMWCPGGTDANGCMMPNTCPPMQGPQVGNGGNLCPGICPTPCAPEDMICPGAIDPNGCLCKGGMLPHQLTSVVLCAPM